MITLTKANINDCALIHQMQIESFMPIFEKYQDNETSPVKESIERIIAKMNSEQTDYYFIELDNVKIGTIRIVRKSSQVCRVSPIFILPQYQGNGYAQTAMEIAESLYPLATIWKLDTIKEEPKLCYLYEKLGYTKTGKEETIKDGMTIVYYEKVID